MCLPQTRLQKSVPLATKMSSICQTILQLVSLMTYLFDQMFLRSRLQLSSLFKLIPKPPCSGEKNPCPFWRMSGSLWLDGFDLFIYFRMLHSQILSEHIVRRSLQPSCAGSPCSAGVWVAEGSTDQTQDLGDLRCMQKSNHAATTLGYYFSIQSCVRIFSCRSQSWVCHSKHFTHLHGINQVIVSLGCFDRNLYSRLRGSHSSTYAFQIFVFSDGPAKSELQELWWKCIVGREAL